MSIKAIILISIAALTSSILAAPVADSLVTNNLGSDASQVVKMAADSFSGDGTYYTPGLGSCGWNNNDNEMVAALNHVQMTNGPNPNNNPKCGKFINVKGPRGSVRVKIIDTCPVCSFGDVDLSSSAFKKIANIDDGRVRITWSWA